MITLYKQHIVKSEIFEAYNQDEIEYVNQMIVKEMYTHPEDFHFFSGQYQPVTKAGELFLEKLYIQFKKRKFYRFSFSNGEYWVYEEWTFSIE